jgi:transposase
LEDVGSVFPCAEDYLNLNLFSRFFGRQSLLSKIKVLSGFSVEYLGDNRNEDSLDGYFGKLSPKRREKIESIAVDMWDPYLASIRKHVPDADVRKAESREMVKNNNERLKRTKCPWLYSKENAPKEETGWLWAEKHFKAWFFWATHLKLALVITAAWTFKRHLDHILKYVQHRITHAVSRGLNSKV